MRIAREVHDITAHSLSAVSIQAAVAERLVESDPPAAKEAISTVRSTAKSALEEMRAMIGVLRSVKPPRPSRLEAPDSSGACALPRRRGRHVRGAGFPLQSGVCARVRRRGALRHRARGDDEHREACAGRRRTLGSCCGPTSRVRPGRRTSWFAMTAGKRAVACGPP